MASPLVLPQAHRASGAKEAEMTKYLAGVLTVIAAGVLLVAYGLFNPQNAMDASAAMPAMTPAVAEQGAIRALADGSVVYVPVARPSGYAVQSAALPASMPVTYVAQPAAAVPMPVSYTQPVASVAPAPVRAVSYQDAQQRPVTRTRYVERAPRRDWKRTALIIGGSSATGAGVGAIFGGKKGALIGAAIGGGASTIYQTVK
jgi:hypothetical protein